MNTSAFPWILLIIFGTSLSLFTAYFSLSKIEAAYKATLEYDKEDVLKTTKINNLKTKNSELKDKIEELNMEVNELGQQMNEHLMAYRTSKQFLDSLISNSQQNTATLDTIIAFYNEEILNNTKRIDSINHHYEIKSSALLQFIKDLESNSSAIELVFMERNMNNKLVHVKTGSVFYLGFIFICTLILGIWLTAYGIKGLKSTSI